VRPPRLAATQPTIHRMTATCPCCCHPVQVCSDPALDSHRFMDAIDQAIGSGARLCPAAEPLRARQASSRACCQLAAAGPACAPMLPRSARRLSPCLLPPALPAGDAKRHKAYSAWAKQTAARPRPADPLKPRKAGKKQADSMGALVAAIRGKVREEAGAGDGGGDGGGDADAGG
jgi:hypothetical protein